MGKKKQKKRGLRIKKRTLDGLLIALFILVFVYAAIRIVQVFGGLASA